MNDDPVDEKQRQNDLAQIIRERYGARAVSIVTGPERAGRLSVNDAWVALYDACHKMSRVALRRHEARGGDDDTPLALETLFPEPLAYLICSLLSVVQDARRIGRIEKAEADRTTSLDAGLSNLDGAGANGSFSPMLARRLVEDRALLLPEAALLHAQERQDWKINARALDAAARALPAAQTEVILADLRRRRLLQSALPPASDVQRQRLRRARKALAKRAECLLRASETCESEPPWFGDKAGAVRVNRSSPRRAVGALPVPTTEEGWDEKRLGALLRERFGDAAWTERVTSPNGDVEEAVVHDIGGGGDAPSAALRAAVRVMDRAALKASPVPRTEAAQTLWDEGRSLRKQGKLEEATRAFRACNRAEPSFSPARIAGGVTLFRLGRLAEARDLYLDVARNPNAGADRFVAASNVSEVYLTWFRTGHGDKERNLNLALYWATRGLEQPTPARAVNLLLAYVEDRRFREATGALRALLVARPETCPPDALLRTLSQIQEPSLLAWWRWLENNPTTIDLNPKVAAR